MITCNNIDIISNKEVLNNISFIDNLVENIYMNDELYISIKVQIGEDIYYFIFELSEDLAEYEIKDVIDEIELIDNFISWEINDLINFDDLHDIHIDELKNEKNFSNILQVANNIITHGEKYILLANNGNYLYISNDIEKMYMGEYDSEIEFVQSLWDDLYSSSLKESDLPDDLFCYIDWKKLAKDYRVDFLFLKNCKNRVYVFNNL